MGRCNELCTKETTGQCAVCEALAEHERFIQFWFKGGLLLEGIRALKRGRVFTCLHRYAWRMARLWDRGKAPQGEYPGFQAFLGGYGTCSIVNRILSGVRRPKDRRSSVQPAWSTPDRIGWAKPLPRGARAIGNWNPRPRAPRHAGDANPPQEGHHRSQVAPHPRLCTAAHRPTRSAWGKVPASAHARGPSRRGTHRACRGEERQQRAS